MEPRRPLRAIIDPRVRQVSFITPNVPTQPPERTQSYPPVSNSPLLSESPSSNSLSPVMIPPPGHLSDNLTAYGTPAVPVPESSLGGVVVQEERLSQICLELSWWQVRSDNREGRRCW
ncbi:hypothetical protein CDL15_Pgr004033 [Punica granatum]|uniref:Uncharacterized protein n=1 Tax=Punica granatum TaxID=22663 RepID=A0A218XFA7_PUNGR|nr:hypothetical protein CDL15_Pgr004033 [Punica granatum]PKI61588.1 hypothetical protein CRG98_018017 [Punica granatum]